MENQRENEILSVNLTHKYNPDCAHLDDWKEIGKITILREDKLENDEGYAAFVYFFFQAFEPTDESLIREAIQDKYRRSCSCPHDCCGHATGGAYRVERIDPNIWRAKVSYSPNY